MRGSLARPWIALVLLLAAVAGCTTGWPAKRLFAPSTPALNAPAPSAPTARASTASAAPVTTQNAAGDASKTPSQGEAGVVPASFEQPRYVPPAGSSIVGMGGDGDDELVEKKSTLEKVGETLAPKNLGKKFRTAIGKGPDEAYAQRKYEEGQKLFREKKYEDAAKCFKEAAGRWPDSALEEDSMFLVGESWFFADRYTKARDAYQALIKKYEGSRYEDKVALRYFSIGKYWDECAQKESHWYPNLKDKTRPFADASGQAISLYTASRTHDPRGGLADDATMAVANLYFRKNRFEDAATHYDMVIKNPRNNKHVLDAHVLGMQSRLRSYLGPQYEVSPLDEAEKLAEQALISFPDEQLGAEKQHFQQARKAIRFERSQREFQAGEYYYNLKYYRSARIYYQRTIANYPDTPFAKLAEERMAETKDLPPVPPDYFKWVKKIFPESKASLNR
ncbi:MAG TPA: tetratricopeptide repeat protein [Pirellulales bacterium]|nr:tetratricopeptide repeat protein [Pirellulales bacterium]